MAAPGTGASSAQDGARLPAPAPREVRQPTPVPTPDYAAVRVQAAALNVRAAPSTEAPRIAQVQAGQVLRATARLADQSWWQVCCLANRYGWVSGAWIEPVGPADKLANLPARELNRTPTAPTRTPLPQ